MGKGSKPRPVSKNYGAEIERIFGKRCLRHRRVDCVECSQPKETPPSWWDQLKDSDDRGLDED